MALAALKLDPDFKENAVMQAFVVKATRYSLAASHTSLTAYTFTSSATFLQR